MTFFKWHLRNDRVNWKSWWKLTKKSHLINDKVEYVLFYQFLNDKSSIQIMCPGKKKLIRPHVLKREWMWKRKYLLHCIIFVYIFEEIKLEWTFANLLVFKNLSYISQTFLTMAKTINTESFHEAWESESCLWDVSSVIYKNRYEKAKSKK